MPYKDPEKRRDHWAGYYAANREKLLRARARYRIEHPEQDREACARYDARHREKRKAYKRGYRMKNRKKFLAYGVWYRAGHREKLRKMYAAHYAKNREAQKKRSAAYRAENPEKVRKALANWHIRNLKKVRAYRAKYKAENPEIFRAISAKARANPRIRLTLNVLRSIRSSLKDRKRGHWETLVGYTLADLMAHLKARFLPGMTWENMGRGGWQVDHIIPVSAFNFETAEDVDFKRCWALSNLQPLWESDNIRKAAKLEAPFQPSLKLRIQGPKHTPRNAKGLCDSKSGMATHKSFSEGGDPPGGFSESGMREGISPLILG